MAEILELPYRFLGHVIIRGIILCIQPLHMGGTHEEYKIGGLDNPVIRETHSREPYVPGSGLKGRMRFLLEWATDLVRLDNKLKANPHSCSGIIWGTKGQAKSFCPVCLSFGSSADEQENRRLIGPTRLVVRNSYLTEDSREQLEELRANRGIPMTETRTEISIDRINALANPRPMEYVLKGTKFNLELVYSIYNLPTLDILADFWNKKSLAEVKMNNGEDDLNHLKGVFWAMRMLEDATLGGSGSRGAGKVVFLIEPKAQVRRASQYKSYVEIPQMERDQLCLLSSNDFKEDEYLLHIKKELIDPELKEQERSSRGIR